MAVEAMLFLDDRIHSSVPTTVFASDSGVEVGYCRDNVRDADFGIAWKPDDGTVDETLWIDGGSTTWLGSVGETVYSCIGFDCRHYDGTNIEIRYSPADDFSSATGIATFAIDKTAPGSSWVSFTIPSNSNGLPKRYYQLLQRGSQRSPGLDRTARVYSWAMFKSAGVFRMGSNYAADTTAPGGLHQFHQVQEITTQKRSRFTNTIARPQQEFDLTFRPASLTLWQDLRDAVYGLDGPKRAFFAQFDGLRNPAQQDFAMVMMVRERVETFHRQADQYDVTITLVTVPTF